MGRSCFHTSRAARVNVLVSPLRITVVYGSGVAWVCCLRGPVPLLTQHHGTAASPDAAEHEQPGVAERRCAAEQHRVLCRRSLPSCRAACRTGLFRCCRGSTEALEGTVPTQQSACPGTCLSHADGFISQKNALLYCEIGFLTTWSNVSQGSSGLSEVDTELLMLWLPLRVWVTAPCCRACAVLSRGETQASCTLGSIFPCETHP